jgi:acyltransferase
MTATTTTNSNRIDSIDIAKGIGITLVVLFHTRLEYFTTVRDIIYTFYMPLFFFISGICFQSGKYPLKDFIKKRWIQLMRPAIIFTLVITIISYFSDKRNSFINLKDVFPYALWFLPILYFSSLLAFIILKYNTNFVRQLWFVCILICIGYALQANNVQLPYFLQSIPLATSFYILGNLTKTKLQRVLKHPCPNLYIIAASLLFITGCLLLHPQVNIARNRMQPFAASYILSCIAIYITLILSGTCKRYYLHKRLTYLGPNSLPIMCVHQFIMVKAIHPIIDVLEKQSSILHSLRGDLYPLN